MKASVYHLGGTIGVCELYDEDGTMYVAECSVTEDGSISVFPQSVRLVHGYIDDLELEVADDPSPQDRVDRTAHGIERFLQRLAEFSVDEVTGCDVEQLLERAELGERALRGLRLSVRERA